ncbi:MAG: hypothetical protein E7000_07210 [Coriobacteriaceae bacterium]|nr:hypothetical protein [Coriobacteriaceae bacterium]
MVPEDPASLGHGLDVDLVGPERDVEVILVAGQVVDGRRLELLAGEGALGPASDVGRAGDEGQAELVCRDDQRVLAVDVGLADLVAFALEESGRCLGDLQR